MPAIMQYSLVLAKVWQCPAAEKVPWVSWNVTAAYHQDYDYIIYINTGYVVMM